ncbi:hypothetical protein AB4X15_03020 [Peribacillus simplex]|uniref:hypothetical protein n=1 Tax=Peribacillus simplex TaxID=1478 RepID=UPI0034E8571C
MEKHKLIDFDWVITNGYIDKETINKRAEKGWDFVVTVPAKLIHPSACDHDKATIFSKYAPYPKDENEVHDSSG